MSVCSVSMWLPVQRVNVHQKLKHRRAYPELAQGTIWNGACYRAGLWAGTAKHQLCEISIVLPEEVPGQQSALQPCRAGRQQDPHWNQAATGRGTGFPPTQHLPGFCHTAPEAAWLLGITCGRTMDGSCKPFRICYQTIPAVGVHRLGKDTQLSFWALWDSLVNQIATKVPDIKRFTCRFNQLHPIKIKISISRYSSIFVSQEMLNSLFMFRHASSAFHIPWCCLVMFCDYATSCCRIFVKSQMGD